MSSMSQLGVASLEKEVDESGRVCLPTRGEPEHEYWHSWM